MEHRKVEDPAQNIEKKKKKNMFAVPLSIEGKSFLEAFSGVGGELKCFCRALPVMSSNADSMLSTGSPTILRWAFLRY